MKAAPTVQPLLTFGQCLKNILGARKLSASALSRMMEQKSRNSMFRILDDTGGPAVQAAFFESLKASDCLHLTEQEERELERALEVSHFGVAGYMTNQAMHRLLGDVDLQAAADDSLRVDRSRDGSVTTLRESMERLLSIGSPDERNIEIVERMMREDRPKMHPIKREFQTSGSPEGYLAYTKSLQRLEQGRSIYDIKLDVPINFVAPEVLVGPARDGFAAHGFAQDDALEEMIGQFYKVHQKRFDNYFQKRRPTHAIFSRQAMEQFAQTGLESDHFFAIRPFSPAERVSILTHLKEQNETNPNFCLYFFKPGYRQPRTEICLYEGAGTMLTVADTDYDLSGAHSEVLITQTEFSRKYKAFFIHDLLESKVLSPAETQRTFEELIEIARNA